MTFVFDASASNVDFSRPYDTGSDNEQETNVLQVWGRFDNGRPSSPEGINQGAVLAAEGIALFTRGRNEIALEHFNKALAIDANNCNCLIARSKCHLQLGDHTEALKDAEAALHIDPNSYKAIYQKAEALYARGDFELALVFYCRGAQARKELDCFRLGVQKAQEAISNVVGRPEAMHFDAAQFQPDREKDSALETERKASKPHPEGSNGSGRGVPSRETKSITPRSGPGSRSSAQRSHAQRSRATQGTATGSGGGSGGALLGKLQNDMEYLENLLHHPGLQPISMPAPASLGIGIGAPSSGTGGRTSSGSTKSDKNKTVSSQVKEALSYLKARQEFWLQQKPIQSRRNFAANKGTNGGGLEPTTSAPSM